jgi:hypothetical protein
MTLPKIEWFNDVRKAWENTEKELTDKIDYLEETFTQWQSHKLREELKKDLEGK